MLRPREADLSNLRSDVITRVETSRANIDTTSRYRIARAPCCKEFKASIAIDRAIQPTGPIEAHRDVRAAHAHTSSSIGSPSLYSRPEISRCPSSRPTTSVRGPPASVRRPLSSVMCIYFAILRKQRAGGLRSSVENVRPS